jgi:bifunctional non-homologous end joining protein LigD
VTKKAELPDLSRYGRLAEYNRKRHFGVTPEPPGRARPAATARPRALEFVVQKHRATRLHYDFRLEHRGVMLSWAVPKGPSPDPKVKRLAMETEPHPMDYNQFEGVIPEGEYGGGTVMIWDRGVWAPIVDGRLGQEGDVDRQLAKGELKLILLGKKLSGSWTLVRTGDRQWLLMKHRDEYASEEDLAQTRSLSIVSGRTLAGIARAAGASARQLAQAQAADPASAPDAASAAKPRAVRPEPANAKARRSPRMRRPAPTPGPAEEPRAAQTPRPARKPPTVPTRG